MAATAEPATTGTKDIPTTETVTRNVCGVTVLCKAGAIEHIADVEGYFLDHFVTIAFRDLRAGARWPHERTAQQQRTAILEAIAAQQLKGADGKLLRTAQLRPLVAPTRRRLVVLSRQRQREQRVNDRAAARERARREAKQQKIRDKVLAKALIEHAHAALPDGTKPVAGASSDKGRDVRLRCGQVVRHPRTKRWMLVVTDSYQMTVLPLHVVGDAIAREALIAPDTLKEVQKGGGFRVYKDGSVQALKLEYGSESVPDPTAPPHSDQWAKQLTVSFAKTVPLGPATRMEAQPQDPAGIFGGKTRVSWIKRPGQRGRGDRQGGSTVKGIMPEKPIPASRLLEVTFDASLLEAAAAALGHPQRHVTLQLDAGAFVRGKDGVRRWGREAIRVAPSRKEGTGMPRRESPIEAGAHAVLMPVRP